MENGKEENNAMSESKVENYLLQSFKNYFNKISACITYSFPQCSQEKFFSCL